MSSSFLLVLTATAGLHAQSLSIVSGNGQLVKQQFRTPLPMVVVARDAGGSPLANVEVTWTVSKGMGSLQVPNALTDDQGMANASFVATDLQPGYSFDSETVTASSRVGSVAFAVTTFAGLDAPTVFTLVPANGGSTISGQAGSTLPGAIQVQVIASSGFSLGQGVPNIGLRIPDPPSPDSPWASCNAPGGTILTDSYGIATCNLVLNRHPGTVAFNGVVGELSNTTQLFLSIAPGPACSYTVTPVSQSFSSAGGVATATVQAGGGCDWTATSNAPWITVTSAASGTGNGTVSYVVAPSTSAAQTGTLLIAGQTITINQTAVGTGAGLNITTGTNLGAASVGAAFTANLAATGGQPPYRWSATGNVPPGLSISPLGVISGTPTAAGIYAFTVNLSDAFGATVTQSFSLAVSAAGSSNLTITNSSFPAAIAGQLYQAALTAANVCTTPFSQNASFSLVSGNLPAGLLLQPNSLGAYVLTGTPTAAGAYPFTLGVRDGCGNTAQQAFTLTVGGVGAATVSTVPSALTFRVAQGSATAPATQTINLTSTAVGQTFNIVPSTTTGGNWLSVPALTGAIPGALTVGVANFAALQPGSYTGNLSISSPGAANSPVVIPVTLEVTRVAGQASVAVAPAALAFTMQAGSTIPPTLQLLSVNANAAGLDFLAAANTTAGGNWLTVTSLASSIPGAVNVGIANASALAPGSYSGTVSITSPSASNSPVSVPVTLTITPAAVSNSLIVGPAAIAFSVSQGSAGTPATQSIAVSSSNGGVNYLATASTALGGGWLNVFNPAGTTPNAISVGVSNTAALAAGNYTGTVTITPSAAGSSPASVPVTLTVTPPATLTLAPANVGFTYTPGNPLPATAKVAVMATGTALPFTVSAATSDSANWLSASPPAGSAPASLEISANPAALGPGIYTGVVTVTSSTGVPPVQISVTLTVGSNAPVIGAVDNAASFQTGPVAPGEIITIFGSHLGPSAGASLQLNDAGTLATTLAGSSVLFDGLPAPMVYASERQISAIVPYEINGRATTNVTVTYNGQSSAPVNLKVIDTAPGVFTSDTQGTGAIVNPDGTLNSETNPAAPDSIVSLYLTGEGQTSPAGLTGTVNATDAIHPMADVAVKIGDAPAEILYAGEAPGGPAGQLQVNVRIPANVSGHASIVLDAGIHEAPKVYVWVR